MLAFILLALIIAKTGADCPSNTTEWNSNCFLFFGNSSGFADAELSCTNMGGHLASIHDGFTNALLAQEGIKRLHESTETDLWIGATNLMKPPTWNWSDGSTFDFTDWKQGEPQNTSGANCATLSLTDGYWIAQDCFKPKPFVCQVTSGYFTTTSPPTTTYPLTANCSRGLGWSYFAPIHSCYGADFGGFVGNWSTSQNYCQSRGANLSSIHSVYEFQYLMSYLYVSWKDIWIGIFSVDGDRTWKTADDTDADFFKYGNWCPENPSNISGERCVGLCSCGYCDKDCSVNFTTICKKVI